MTGNQANNDNHANVGESFATANARPDQPTTIDGEIVAIDGHPIDPTTGRPIETVDRHDERGAETNPVVRLRDRQRPVLPAWARTWREFGTTVAWLCRFWTHVVAYHAVRLPKYAATLAVRAPRGIVRATVGTFRWVWDVEGLPARLAAVRRDDVDQYLKLSRQRDQRVRARLAVFVPALILCLVGAVIVWFTAPDYILWSAGLVLVALAGVLGRPPDRRLLDRAVVPTRAAKLTSDVVLRAMTSLGIGQINEAARAGGGVSFPAPIVRDGPGWRATMDLPYGVTATDVLERRDRLASGLRRPLGCVWPEPSSTEHAGRLVLWVGDEDISQARPRPWPLRRSGTANVFTPVPFGVDQRGRQVGVTLMFNSLLIGAMPRVGKTMALRVLLLALALDVTAELRVFELKGTGDLSALEHCAHHYASGADERTIDAALASLRELHADLDRRAKVIKGLPRTVCPENKVTPHLASRGDLGLHPVVFAVDECQELFAHPEVGKEAATLATAIIKRGPAMGVILALATQRPDAESLPTGISANVGIRFCLRVMGQQENDMVLGTSAYRNGLRATTFGPRDRGIGYLVGASDDPQIVKTQYLDAEDAERIGQRARGLRERVGRLSGHALGQSTETEREEARHADTLLDDVHAAFATDDKTWSDNLVTRLAAAHPEQYRGWNARRLGFALRPYGVTTGQVWAEPDGGGEPGNRRGLTREAIAEALRTRDHRPTPSGPDNTDPVP